MNYVNNKGTAYPSAHDREYVPGLHPSTAAIGLSLGMGGTKEPTAQGHRLVARFSVNQLARDIGTSPQEVREVLEELSHGPLKPLEPMPADDDRPIRYELVTARRSVI